MRALAAAVLVTLAVGTGAARAQTPTAIDVRDLPPLPRLAQDESVTNVAVIAATQASEDVVSGAAKRDQSLGNVASAVTVLNADRLRRFGYRTVAEALRAVCGLYIVDDRQTERVGIRALQILGDFNTHILVLVDGVTINEPWNQYVGIGADMPVSIDEIARIEVIRGPVSSLYGTNAFFGIVNIVTRAAGEAPRAYGRASAGTFGTFTGNAGFAVGSVNRQLRGAVSFLRRLGEDLTIPQLGGEVSGTDGNLALQASVVGHWDGLFGQLRAYDKEREIAAAPYETAVGDDRNKYIDRQLLGEVGYTHELGGGRGSITARTYFSRYQFQDYLVYEPDEANFRDIGDSLWFGGEVRGFIHLVSAIKLDLTVGAEAIWNHVNSESFSVDDRAGGVAIPTDFSTEGVYAELAAEPLPWLGFSAGARFDNNSQFTTNLSPRAALFLHARDDFGLKLLFADGFRYPSSYEAFFADNKTFVANPGLDPERIRSYEAVLWGRPLPGLSLRLSGFRWELRDIIEIADIMVMDESRLQFQNITTMKSTGAELEASYRDTGGWLASASATVAKVERNDGMEPAPNAPVVVAKLQGSTPLLFKLFHISTELQVTSGRHTRDAMVDTDAFADWNLVLFAPNIHGVDVTVGARNLLGTREQVPTSDEVDRDGGAVPVVTLPGEGRELFARVGFSY